jgi:hypothetical protein
MMKIPIRIQNGARFNFKTAKVGDVYEHEVGIEKFRVVSTGKKIVVKFLAADPDDNPGLKGQTVSLDPNDTTLEFYAKV